MIEEHSNENKAYAEQDFIIYAEALEILKSRLQAIPDEIAMWISHNKLRAFRHPTISDQVYFSNPKYINRDDYKNFLTYLYFLRDEVKQFEPTRRYISRADLIERWTKLCGNEEDAIIRIQDGAKGSGLFEHHPFSGADAPIVGKVGCFDLAIVEAIEPRFPEIVNRVSNDGMVSKANGKTELTPNTQTTDKNEREVTQWLRETWIKESKPNGTKFFTALNKYKGQKGSPIIDHYTAGKSAGIKWKSSRGYTGEMSKKTIQNKVSNFKKTSQQNTVNSKK
jgi:hypothetical protein